MVINSYPFPGRASAWPWQSLLDALMLLLWAAVLLRFSLTGQLYLLIHPDYAGLVYLALVILLGLGLGRLNQLRRSWRGGQPRPRSQDHNPLLPRQLTTSLLLAVAVFGLIYSPRPFNSQTAFQRGITDVLGQTRSRPQRFSVSTNPADRTIVDWVHTLHVYPEPDAYTNQPVKVTGFVTIMPGWPEHQFMISRFVLTCCAADAYPVGLAVDLPAGTAAPKADSWLQVTGQMTTVILDGKRQVAIGSARLTAIPEPRTPYAY
ncbi:MAG: TIGR03943 family protein [Cyanobacteria bacterium REEB459]|nr:TIGR03943 family protein [Cyanobacteria bacterium REEB459]